MTWDSNESRPIKAQIQNMAMYLFQAYINHGLEQNIAKNQVAQDLIELAKSYSDVHYDKIAAGILVDKAIKQINNKASRQVVLNTLIDIKTVMSKED